MYVTGTIGRCNMGRQESCYGTGWTRPDTIGASVAQTEIDARLLPLRESKTRGRRKGGRTNWVENQEKTEIAQKEEKAHGSRKPLIIIMVAGVGFEPTTFGL